MDNKQTYERAELQKTIWSIADELRGAVDGWDFKQYVLGMLFYRYISENLTNYINKGEKDSGNKSFDYTKISDKEAEKAREGLIDEKGFFIVPSELFINVYSKAENDNSKLNEILDKAFKNIEKSSKGTKAEKDFKGLFEDFDVNSNKLGGTVPERNKRLFALMNGIKSMQLGDFKDNTIDAFGDAYEFLMSMYASKAGKSGGEFFTPQEVSKLLTLLAIGDKKQVNKVYDPACGSGSLLLQSAKILGKENVKTGFFGQEINITTYNLCRINMFLHDIDYNKFDIAYGDTLINPLQREEEQFDVIVTNPPYSIDWVGDDDITLINDDRFAPAGVLAPKSKADYAFIMHSLSSLSSDGAASIVCFPGIFYREGAEQKIRKYLVDNNYVDTIIRLPENLFYGTNIFTDILVLKKNKIDNNILFIDASNEYIKSTNTNILTDRNINNILECYKQRKTIKYYSSLVNYEDIVSNEYSLFVNVYVDKKDNSNKIDIEKYNNEIVDISASRSIHQEKISQLISDDINDKLSAKIKDAKITEYKISDIAIQYNGMTGVSNKWASEGNCKFIDYLNAYTNVKIDTSLLCNATVKKQKQNTIKQGDILCTCASETPDECAFSSVVEDKIVDNVFLDDHLFGLRIKDEFKNIINPSYINYYFRSKKFRLKVNKAVRGVTRFYISNKDFMKLVIPIPSLEVQNEICDTLDNFVELEKELEKELENRKVQYKYYIDNICSFGGE